LIDVLDARDAATAGGYREMAIRVLDDLRKRKRLSAFSPWDRVGIYVLLPKAAERRSARRNCRDRFAGVRAANIVGAFAWRATAARYGISGAHRCADEQKLIRAIEVSLLPEKPLLEVQSQRAASRWRVAPCEDRAAATPELLYERIHARTEAMLAADG